MKKTKEDKAALVDEIADRLGGAEAIFAVDYRGITVPQAAELRARLAEAETSFHVVKNRLALRATERAGTAELNPLFEGPTALAFVKGDAVAAAKAISTFGRQHEILAYKGGLMDGAPLDPDQFTTIARLPGLDVLHGQLAGVVASPLTGLVRGLGSMLSGLALALGQIQEQGLVGGEEVEPAQQPKQSDEAQPEESTEETPEEPAAEESAEEEPEETAKKEPAGASDEVAEEASEPAASPEPEPAGNGAIRESSDQRSQRLPGEASGGDVSENDDGSEEAGSEEVEAEGETSEEGQ